MQARTMNYQSNHLNVRRNQRESIGSRFSPRQEIGGCEIVDCVLSELPNFEDIRMRYADLCQIHHSVHSRKATQKLKLFVVPCTCNAKSNACKGGRYYLLEGRPETTHRVSFLSAFADQYIVIVVDRTVRV